MTATGSSSTYYPSDLCTSPANDTGYLFPGFFNAVLVKGLLPATKYYYVVGDPVPSPVGQMMYGSHAVNPVMHTSSPPSVPSVAGMRSTSLLYKATRYQGPREMLSIEDNLAHFIVRR
jgi:hypothetical protein